jgi:DNA-binding CsgD family transcriptional regulator
MLLGREVECARINQVLADARGGMSGALIVLGEPGIGKTSMLGYAAEIAQGMTTLSARGIESEAEVAFSGLLELFRPVLDEIDRIPGPQASALRGALALGPALESDRFLIGAATLSLLAALAEDSPLLVLIDDSQWLDDSSGSALVFAARRLLADSVAIVATERLGYGSLFAESGLPQLHMEGLTREVSTALLVRHARRVIPSEVANNIYQATAGNPLALVELVGAGHHLDSDLIGVPMPISARLEQAFLRRTGELSLETRRALVVAAAVDSGELIVIQQAAALLGLDVTVLAEAEKADLISVTEARLEWRHPIIRSAVYHEAAASERRSIHQAIAKLLNDERSADEQAWHLASGSFGPDETAAHAVQQAGHRARARSAYGPAATAFTRAARLSVDQGLKAQRLFFAADAAWLSGDARRALELLDDTLANSTDRGLRAEALHLRGQVTAHTGPVMVAHKILVEAADEIEASDPRKAAVMRAEAADACVYAGRAEMMLATAQRAWELLPENSDERSRAFVRLALGTALIYNGRGGEGASLLREAIEIIAHSGILGDDPHLLARAAIAPLWLREAETGRALFGRAIQTARSQSALGILPFALFVSARDAATTDRWAVAAAQYDEAVRIARDTGQNVWMCTNLVGLAWLEARQGHDKQCRDHSHEGLELSERLGLDLSKAWALSALGDLELGSGRLEEALTHLEAKDQLLAEIGIADPDISPAPDLVEVLVRMGRADQAEPIANDFSKRSEEKGQPWALSVAARCRGLLAEESDYERHFEDAFRHHHLSPDTFEQARTHLCLGERLRRSKQRTKARKELRAAFEAFEELGATPWAERAYGELKATGETARRRDVSTLYQLTPQELQIAMVLAEGRTTREAATKLFLSPKTIEYHLRNAYRKLGINSRDALKQALKEQPTANLPATEPTHANS